MALASLSNFKFRPPNVLEPSKIPDIDLIHTSRLEVLSAQKSKNATVSRKPNSRGFHGLSHGVSLNRLRTCSSVLARASGDAAAAGSGEIFTAENQSSASDLDALRESSYSSGDGYVALFVGMLGLDNHPMDREQAVQAIWKYSLRGKEYIDNIMRYHGIVNLVVNLLRSDSDSSCEAAAAFLRTLSSINVYRDVVAECGAIEEMTGLLRRASLSSDVKQQVLCTLWNLSVDEKLRLRITNSDIIPLLVKFLEDEDSNVKEASGGVLANLALSLSNHKIMVEAGVIPKLAKLLMADAERSKVIRNVARNILLELAKDEYNRILIMEEGLLLVPLVGSAAYESSIQSLNTRQRLTIFPWRDAVAQLVLIIGLEDESAVATAAGFIADACISEDMRVSFREAGAIRSLVQLINHHSDSVKVAAVRALDRLSISIEVCQTIEAEGVLHPLINLLKNSMSCHTLTTMILNILTRVLDPNKDMKSKFDGGPLNESIKDSDLAEIPTAAKENEMIPSTSTSSLQIDSTFLSCLVDILKTSSLEMQRKAASTLEFIAATNPRAVLILSVKIEAGLQEVFQQKSIIGKEYDIDDEEQEQHILELEEAGRAVSAASRLLTRLLDYEEFRQSTNLSHFTDLLRDILISPIPVQHKDWVAACLVKLSSFLGHKAENRITVEVTLHEAIPRLVEKLENSFSSEAQEAAVLELYEIMSESWLDSTRAVASHGAIFPVVKLMEFCSDQALEACLAILYNLSMDSENHAAIIAAGAVPILRKIVQSERPEWMRALRLLRTLPT